MNDIGERLRDIQNAFGLTQRKMAARAGVHINSMQNYQAGKRIPDGSFLEKICREFSVSPRWLLIGGGGMLPGASETEDGVPVEDKARLLSSFAAFTPDRRRKIEQLGETLHAVQRRNRSEQVVGRIKATDGTEPEKHEQIAAALRIVDAEEWKVLAAYCLSRSHSHTKKTRTLLPKTITEKKVVGLEADDQSVTLSDDSEYDVALEEFERRLDDLIRGDTDQ